MPSGVELQSPAKDMFDNINPSTNGYEAKGEDVNEQWKCWKCDAIIDIGESCRTCNFDISDFPGDDLMSLLV